MTSNLFVQAEAILPPADNPNASLNPEKGEIGLLGVIAENAPRNIGYMGERSRS